MDYVRIYMQKMDRTLSTGKTESYPVKDVLSDFGLYAKSIPFKMSGEAKELPSNDFKDEDGSDEYFPDVLRLKSYEVDIEFAYKGSKGSANAVISKFLTYLTGRDDTGVALKLYDTHTKIGRQNVRFSKLSDDAELVREDDGDILIFKVTFKVNDPVTDIVLTK